MNAWSVWSRSRSFSRANVIAIAVDVSVAPTALRPARPGMAACALTASITYTIQPSRKRAHICNFDKADGVFTTLFGPVS